MEIGIGYELKDLSEEEWDEAEEMMEELLKENEKVVSGARDILETIESQLKTFERDRGYIKKSLEGLRERDKDKVERNWNEVSKVKDIRERESKKHRGLGAMLKDVFGNG